VTGPAEGIHAAGPWSVGVVIGADMNLRPPRITGYRSALTGLLNGSRRASVLGRYDVDPAHAAISPSSHSAALIGTVTDSVGVNA
jgi:hypothetical protein